jgi:hypothetical protein
MGSFRLLSRTARERQPIQGRLPPAGLLLGKVRQPQALELVMSYRWRPERRVQSFGQS